MANQLQPEPGRKNGGDLMSGYRIGFLNPWETGAEIQAFESLRLAANRLGHEFVLVRNSEEILCAAPDFVLAIEPGQPKVTDVPTFGVVHSPRSILMDTKSHLENISYLDSLLTYDGCLTISDKLREFLSQLYDAFGRPKRIGFYYNTPQRQPFASALPKIVSLQTLRLCYFGMNWEPRARPFFRELATRPYMRIYGPEERWQYLQGRNFFGSLPFDGNAVQRTYASFGAGLVVLSTAHLLDDVISNRIFEIASVGAVVVAPDIPWISKNFGESVYYYDRFAPPAKAVLQIDTIMDEIQTHPNSAAERALAARKIFEEKFAGEVMVESAVRYFEAWRTESGGISPATEGPSIDVVVRVTQGSTAQLLTTLRSVDAQSRGRFRIILACCGRLDLSPIIGASWKRIEGFEIVEAAAGQRAAALALGLGKVGGEWFAVLEEDDIWLCNHVASLLAAAARLTAQEVYAYSGVVTVATADGETVERPSDAERRHISSMSPVCGDLEQLAQSSTGDTFLASSTVLRSADFSSGMPEGFEKPMLHALLLVHAEPVFSYRATVCVPERSLDAMNPVTRNEGYFQMLVRLHGVSDRLASKLASHAASSWEPLRNAMQQLLETQRQLLAPMAAVLAVEGGSIVPSVHDRDDVSMEPIAFDQSHTSLGGSSRFIEHNGETMLEIVPPDRPWNYGAVIPLNFRQVGPALQWIVMEFGPAKEPMGVGLLNRDGSTFQTRMQLPVSQKPIEIWLQVQNGIELGHVLIQNWVTAATAPVILRRIWRVTEKPIQGDIRSDSSGNVVRPARAGEQRMTTGDRPAVPLAQVHA